MRAKYPERGCPQRDSMEREEYAGAQSSGAREGKERDGAEDLFEATLDRDNLNQAYKQVNRNHGAPGIDGMTVEGMLPRLREHKEELLKSIRDGSYQLSPVRRKEIPKSDGGVRKLGIPTVVDRVIQQAIATVLANIYLTEFDWEMESRGVNVIRYVDDIVVLSRSQRAAKHLLRSSQNYLEGMLKLKVNAQKSKMISIFAIIKQFKFLCFCLGKNGKGIYIRAHRQSLTKAKRKQLTLTCRNQGKNVRSVMNNVKVLMRGWLGYYYVANIKRTLQRWNEWLRRRFRMYIWKQWKKSRTWVQNLQRLGISKDLANQWGNIRRGYWRIAGSAILSRSITNEKLVLAGHYDFPAQYEQFCKLYLCD